jgi:hypothetical protein
VPNGGDLGLTDVVPGDPRMYFLQAGYKF